MGQETIKTYQGRDASASTCLVELEGFIGDMDGKTVGTADGDGYFSDEGTVDASNAVIAINGLIWSLERAEAEIGRLEKQCEGLAAAAMGNGQGLLIFERALERIKELSDSEAGEPLDDAIRIATEALAFEVPDAAITQETQMTEHPDWPPRASAVGLPDGEQRRGSTGQWFEVKNGQWIRLREKENDLRDIDG